MGIAVTHPYLVLKFDGGDADRHAVDMRALARSMLGFDRILSDCVVLLVSRRLPKRGERAPLIIQAQEPRRGSFELLAFIQNHYDELALMAKAVSDAGGENVWELASAVLEYFGRRKKEADAHVEALVQMNAAHLAARDKSEERIFADQAAWRELIKSFISREERPAVDAVAAIGPSVRRLAFSSSTSGQTVVDEPMAEAIRSKGEMDVSDLQEITLTTDGWIYHNRTLSVHHPEQPGRFMTAKVRDPLADQEPNAYADAALRKATIAVRAKLARRAGALESIYIMDFVGVAEGA